MSVSLLIGRAATRKRKVRQGEIKRQFNSVQVTSDQDRSGQVRSVISMRWSAEKCHNKIYEANEGEEIKEFRRTGNESIPPVIDQAHEWDSDWELLLLNRGEDGIETFELLK